jgi:hypothetical protein
MRRRMGRSGRWLPRFAPRVRVRVCAPACSELSVVGPEWNVQYLAIPVPAASPRWLRDAINYGIAISLSEGVLDSGYRAYFDAPASCASAPNTVTLNEGLGLTELSGIFIAGERGRAGGQEGGGVLHASVACDGTRVGMRRRVHLHGWRVPAAGGGVVPVAAPR